MRSTVILLVLVLNLEAFGQLRNGFDKQEAIDMAALCNSFPFLDLYNSDAEILPTGYKKRYTSGVFGMDNKYQIYERGRQKSQLVRKYLFRHDPG